MKHSMFFCFFFFLFPQSLSIYAQNQHKIDSLLHRLANCREDTNKVRVLDILSWEVSYKDLREGLRYGEEARQLAIKLHDDYGLSRACHDLGSIYVDLGDYAKANDFLYEELNLIESGRSRQNPFICYVALSLLYSAEGKYSRALHFDTLAYNQNKKTNNLRSEAISLINMGSHLEMLGQLDKALEANEKALQLNKSLNKPDAMASVSINIGAIYLRQKHYPEALRYLQTGLDILKKEKMDYMIPKAFTTLGDYYQMTNNPEKAICYYDTATTFFRHTGQEEYLMKAYLKLSDSYETLGDYKKAHSFQKLHMLLKDSLFNDSKVRDLARSEMRYEVDKLKIEQEKKDVVSEQEIRRGRLVSYGLLLGVLGLLIVAFILFRNYRLKQRSNRQLEEKNIVIEEKNKSITDSINYARRIQQAILPPQKSLCSLLPESFILFRPKDIVSGDFYWFDRSGENVFFSAVDCTGHGVPGAMMSVMGYSSLNRCLREFRLGEPASILEKLNELVQEAFEKSEDEVRDGMDLALCSLNTRTRTLNYSGANNPAWIFRREQQNLQGSFVSEELKGDKQPVGKHEQRKAFTNHTVQLKPGDSVYIFSDGYADQFGGENGKKFKYRQLQDLICAIQDKPMKEQEKILLDTFIKWQGKLDQVDDVLVIGVRV